MEKNPSKEWSNSDAQPSKGPECSGNNEPLLLDLLSPTLNHDLPNLMVALQGFLHMFAQEATGDFGRSASECFQRIQGIARKLEQTITTVKLINKIRTQPVLEESIQLDGLVQEVVATVEHHLPEARIRLDTALAAKEIEADRNLLQRALVEMLRLLVLSELAEESRCHLTSRATGSDIVLTLAAPIPACDSRLPTCDSQFSFDSPFSTDTEVDYNLFGPTHQLHVVLIDAIARRWGGRVATRDVPDQGKGIMITIPIA